MPVRDEDKGKDACDGVKFHVDGKLAIGADVLRLNRVITNTMTNF